MPNMSAGSLEDSMNMLGPVLAAFGSTKIRNQYFSPELSNSYKAFNKIIDADKGKYDAAYDAYNTATQKRIADTARIAQQNRGDFNALYDKVNSWGYDPANVYSQIADQNFGRLNQYLANAGEVGRRNRSLAQANLGLAGGRNASWVDSARNRDLNSAAMQGYSATLGSIAPAVQMIMQGRGGNLGQAQGLLGQRLATANYGEGLELLPINALTGLRSDQLGLYGQLGAGLRANIAGFNQGRNWADRASDVATGLNRGANIGQIGFTQGMGTLAGLYGMYAGGGGAGGGGGGGMMGMGGG